MNSLPFAASKLPIRFPSGVPIDGLPWMLAYSLGSRVYSSQMAMKVEEGQFIRVDKKLFASMFYSNLGRSRSQLRTFWANLEIKGVGHVDKDYFYLVHWRKGMSYYTLSSALALWLLSNFETLDLSTWDIKVLPSLLAYLSYRGQAEGIYLASPSSIVEEMGYARNGSKITELKNLLGYAATLFQIEYSIQKSTREHGEAVAIGQVSLEIKRPCEDENISPRYIRMEIFSTGISGLRAKVGDKVFFSPSVQEEILRVRQNLTGGV